MKALLLIQLGTPKTCDLKGVQSYLQEFLGDPCVIDLPWVLRYPLVHFIIVKFRSPKTLSLYQKIWTLNGSPLVLYTQKLVENLNQNLENRDNKLNYKKVFFAMRYGDYSISETVAKIKQEGIDEIDILPMYPQYTLSSTISCMLKLNEFKSQFKKMIWIPYYFNSKSFIEALAKKIIDTILSKNILSNRKVYILFSYHGIPKRHESKTKKYFYNLISTSSDYFKSHQFKTYFDQCHQTTELLMKEVLFGLESRVKNIQYSTAFQSRLGSGWHTPFSDEVIKIIAKDNPYLFVVSPSFTADCLETLEEINKQFREMYLASGGENFEYVSCLNDQPDWILSMLYEHLLN